MRISKPLIHLCGRKPTCIINQVFTKTDANGYGRPVSGLLNVKDDSFKKCKFRHQRLQWPVIKSPKLLRQEIKAFGQFMLCNNEASNELGHKYTVLL